MRKWVLGLGLSTIAFAGSTIYFWLELGRERGHAASADLVTTTTAVSQVPMRTVAQRDAQPAPSSAEASTSGGAARPATREAVIDLEGNGRQMMAERARRILPDFDDPQKRRKMLDEAKASLRGTYRDLGRFLDIGADTEDQLMELLATQQLGNHEAALRCSLDDGCRLQELGRGRRAIELQEVAALIGTDGQRRFEEFQLSMSERMSIAALRGRFNDATRLSDDQTERLIIALAEVRQRAEGELALRNAGLNEYGGGVFGFVYSGNESNVDAQLAEATEYGQRVRERAAQILDKAQLEIFDEARAESLRSLEFMLRQPKAGSR